MDQRISTSVWGALVLVTALDVVGCEGESTSGEGGSGGSDAGEGGSSARGGSSGTGGTPGTGGNTGGRGGTAGRGGSPTGGSGGDAGEGAMGGDAGETGLGGGGAGGFGGDAGGGGDSGGGGDAGDGPVDMTVQGQVIDFWTRPLSGVPVTIGGALVMTDANGRFSVPDVPSQYDVSLAVSWPGGQAGLYGWYFEGLTRRDPVLQVYKGLPNRSTSVTFDPQGETLDASRTLSIALGGPDGFYQEWEDVNGNGLQSSAAWSGPTTALAGVHALLWERASNELPTAFHSYDTTNRTLVDPTATPTIALSLADEAVEPMMFLGSVTTPETTDRTNHVFVRFADGAVIRVVEEYPPPADFGYIAPILPNATVIVAASFGTSFFGAYSIVHKTVPPPGDAGIALDIQAPVTQVVPTNGITGVNASTQFSWNGRNSVYVFHAENLDFYEGFYVVTTRKTITIPTIPGFSLRPGGEYNWRVETHGSSTSVDQVTGSAGHFDTFGADDERPLGRASSSGSYTISTGRVFTTAP